MAVDNGSPTEGRPGVPRWVKVCGVLALAVVVLVVVLLSSGHGPGRHGAAGPLPAAGAGGLPAW